MQTINQFDLKLVEKRSIPAYNEILHFEELSAVIYINKKNNLSAKAFSGRRRKSDFYYRFDSIQSMEKSIESWKKGYKATKMLKKNLLKKVENTSMILTLAIFFIPVGDMMKHG